jgi:RNA polymerase sigma-70 factor, ECF subfamily
MQPDAELISRCLKGEAEAWDQLFDRHYSPVARFICQLSPNLSREDVEEICQEVFLAVIRNLSSFHGSSQLQTWIFRIATNKARDFREHQRAAKRGGGRTILSLQAEDPASGLVIDPPTGAPGPDAQYISAEQMSMVRQALDKLNGPCREIIDLRYFAGLSYEEIGLALKLNPKTVSSRLSKCLDRLEDLARPLFADDETAGRIRGVSRLIP